MQDALTEIFAADYLRIFYIDSCLLRPETGFQRPLEKPPEILEKAADDVYNTWSRSAGASNKLTEWLMYILVSRFGQAKPSM